VTGRTIGPTAKTLRNRISLAVRCTGVPPLWPLSRPRRGCSGRSWVHGLSGQDVTTWPNTHAGHNSSGQPIISAHSPINISRFTCGFLGSGAFPPEGRRFVPSEGGRVLLECLTGPITFRNCRQPWKYSLFRQQGFLGSLVVTNARIIGACLANEPRCAAKTHERVSRPRSPRSTDA
jgi:hypothetical protein